MPKKINGKIIRILDKRTVIINLGKESGVTDSSLFSIMGEPEKIVDPETKDVLGEVTIVKSRVKAKEVAEKFTIATTKWETRRLKPIETLLSTWTKGIEYEKIDNDNGELFVRDEDIEPWKAKSESPVRIGDIVQVFIPDKTEEDKPKLPEKNGESSGKDE